MSSVARIAKRVAQIQIQKMATPLYTDDVFGSLDQYSNVATTKVINPGRGHGALEYFPKVATQLLQSGTSGIPMQLTPGYRKDDQIECTGWSLRGNIIMPESMNVGKVSFTIGTTKLPGAVTGDATHVGVNDFTCPDGSDVLKDREPDATGKRRIHWSRTYTLRQPDPTTSDGLIQNVYKTIDVYTRFKTPIRIRFDGPDNEDWDGRRFFLAFKAWAPNSLDPTDDDHKMQFQGTLRCYYRDL